MPFSTPTPTRFDRSPVSIFDVERLGPALTPSSRQFCEAIGARVDGSSCVVDDTAAWVAESQSHCPEGQPFYNRLNGQCMTPGQFSALAEAHDACAQQGGTFDSGTGQCALDSTSSTSTDDKEKASTGNWIVGGLVVATAIGIFVLTTRGVAAPSPAT